MWQKLESVVSEDTANPLFFDKRSRKTCQPFIFFVWSMKICILSTTKSPQIVNEKAEEHSYTRTFIMSSMDSIQDTQDPMLK